MMVSHLPKFKQQSFELLAGMQWYLSIGLVQQNPCMATLLILDGPEPVGWIWKWYMPGMHQLHRQRVIYLPPSRGLGEGSPSGLCPRKIKASPGSKRCLRNLWPGAALVSSPWAAGSTRAVGHPTVQGLEGYWGLLVHMLTR